MKFLCRYTCRQKPAETYRTVYADGINEATQRAGKWVRKGWLLASVVQQ